MTTASGRTARRAWLGLAVLTLPAVLIAVDLSVLYLAVPRLSADLKPSSAQLLWIIDVYGFVLAGFLVPMGAIGDRIGRRRLLMLGAGAFGLASVAAAYAPNAPTLIAARAVLGVAGATLAPSSLALIGNMFPEDRQRTRAIAIWTGSLSAGGVLGPPLGGVLLQNFWWGSVFLPAVPIMVLLVLTAPWLLPEYADREGSRIDLSSVALSLGSVLSVVYGLKQLAQGGEVAVAVPVIAVGLALGVVFVRRQRRLADPLVDVRLFGNRRFVAALLANLLGFFVVLGVFMLTAQYFQLVRGLSPLPASLLEIPPLLAFTLGAVGTPRLSRAMRPTTVMVSGLVVAATGFLLLTQVSHGGIVTVVAATVVFSLGMSPVFTLVTDTVLAVAPPERAGVVSAMAETSTELGGALGIALLGSLATVVYRMRFAVPEGLSGGESAAARGTLGGAVDVATRLPDEVARQLLGSARTGFVAALVVAAVVSAVIAALLAVTLAWTGRTKSRGPDRPRQVSDTP